MLYVPSEASTCVVWFLRFYRCNPMCSVSDYCLPSSVTGIWFIPLKASQSRIVVAEVDKRIEGDWVTTMITGTKDGYAGEAGSNRREAWSDGFQARTREDSSTVKPQNHQNKTCRRDVSAERSECQASRSSKVEGGCAERSSRRCLQRRGTCWQSGRRILEWIYSRMQGSWRQFQGNVKRYLMATASAFTERWRG